MRKSLWIILAISFLVLGAPDAHADSYTATFIGGCCFVPPAASDVTFPAPTLTIHEQVTFVITLPAIDSPRDTYTWQVGIDGLPAPGPCETCEFEIFDNTTNERSEEDLGSNFTHITVTAGGPLVFTPTPEPSSIVLMLFGAGVLLVMRKRSLILLLAFPQSEFISGGLKSVIRSSC